MNGLELLRATLKNINPTGTFWEWVNSFPITLKDGLFSFDAHPELIFLYQDEHPRKVIRKSVQSGVSTWAILFTIYRALVHKSRCIYYGPTDDWIRGFAPVRFDPLLEQVPEYHSNPLRINEKSLKDFGSSSVHFLGLQTLSKVASIDADTIIIDEASIVPQDMATTSEERLAHSKEPFFHQLSKPEGQGEGIDAAFQESDQHYFMMKCVSCGRFNNVVLQFPDCLMENADGKSAYLGCSHCRKELNPTVGEWAPIYPGKDTRGIQLSQLYWPKHPNPDIESIATDIWKELQAANRPAKRKSIYRGRVGRSYDEGELVLTDGILEANQGEHRLTPSYRYGGFSYMGYDQGDELHVAVMHREGDQYLAHWFETTTKFPRLNAIMDAHNVIAAIGDMKPNTHPAKLWAIEPRNAGRAWVQDFRTTPGDDDLEAKTEKDGKEVPKVILDREENLDALLEALMDGVIVLPKKEGIMEKVWEQLKNLKTEYVESPTGKRKRYKGGNNHFGMALLNAWVATRVKTKKKNYSIGLLPSGAAFYGGNRGGRYAH